jgi:6-O-methylguanine DNA methyltransferase, DNA binding domain
MTTAIDDDLDLPEDQKRAIEPFRRYGLAGRGLGVSLVGIYWMATAIQGEPSKADESWRRSTGDPGKLEGLAATAHAW